MFNLNGGDGVVCSDMCVSLIVKRCWKCVFSGDGSAQIMLLKL